MRDKRRGSSATLARWLELLGDQADHAALKAIYDDLADRYGKPHRHYHTLRHMSRCLEELDGAHSQAEHPLEVELALWFHDAVYDPRRGDNEEASASHARETLTNLIGEEPVERVTRLILATRHTDPLRTSDERLTADIDLAILGSSPDEYREYEDGIRQEYSWMPEANFKAGRAEVMERFLAREHIYNTGRFRERYEEKARANLHHSISALSAPGP